MAREQAKNSGDQKLASEALRLMLSDREPQIDRQREIKTALHDVSRRLGWNVQEFHWNVIARSYHWADIQHGEKSFIIAFEHGSRVVALAERPTYILSLKFFDDVAFVGAVQELNAPFSVLSAADLQSYPTDADRKLIEEHPEVFLPDDMSYYRPQSVGDIIFNWWD